MRFLGIATRGQKSKRSGDQGDNKSFPESPSGWKDSRLVHPSLHKHMPDQVKAGDILPGGQDSNQEDD